MSDIATLAKKEKEVKIILDVDKIMSNEDTSKLAELKNG